MSQKVLWSGRFDGAPDEGTMAFTSSLSVDAVLSWYDAVGSVAHAKMLVRQNIIPVADGEKIVAGLKDIIGQIETGTFDLNETLEDVHSNIEFYLTESIGRPGAASTPRAAATTRWPPTSACSCATWSWTPRNSCLLSRGR